MTERVYYTSRTHAESAMTPLRGSAIYDLSEGLMVSDGLVMAIFAYFDESYDGVAGRGFMGVSGYAFERSRLRRFNQKWGKMLESYELPYFHMNPCNAHKKPFDHLSEPQCDSVAREAIKLIKEHAAFGYGCMVDQDAYREVLTDQGFEVTPYSFATWFCLLAISNSRAFQNRDERASYYFEAGDSSQQQAAILMKRILEDEELRKEFRPTGYGFVDKQESYAAQAADVVAWQIRRNKVHQLAGKPMRGDFKSLVKLPHFCNEIDRTAAEQLGKMIEQASGSLSRASLAMLRPESLVPSRPVS